MLNPYNDVSRKKLRVIMTSVDKHDVSRQTTYFYIHRLLFPSLTMSTIEKDKVQLAAKLI